MAELLPSNSISATPPAATVAEQRAREFLAQGKWRKARDEIKPLVKLDRARHLPLLIQANVGLARELAAKGMVAEARQVLAYLATIAPAAQVRLLELELAGRSQNPEAHLGQFAAALATPTATLPEAEKMRVADQVVLAFAPPPADNPALARLATEVGAIHQGLQAAANKQWEQLPNILRPIPRRSPLSHWTVFLKGLMAFHTGAPERAARFFESLPPASVPAQASRPYLLLAGRLELPKNNPGQAEALVDGVCRLLGQPGAGRLLLRAEQLWREGRHGESYRLWRDSVASFPTDGLDWFGSLSEFYFQAPHQMSREARERYLRFFDGLLYRGTAKNRYEQMRAYRLFALADQYDSAHDQRRDWEAFLGLREQLYQSNPRLASLAYNWLGEQLAQEMPSSGFFGSPSRHPRLRDAGHARHCLEKAIQLDPANLAAHLRLCKVYEALGRRRPRNRLLDEMVERFPGEKPVLLEAARGCIERKAYNKGLDYIERAWQLDRLDPQIPEFLVLARRRLARQYFQQHRLDKARQALEPAQALLTDRPDDLQRSRWTALLRHGLLEQLFGDPALGETLLAQARAANPFPAAFLFFAHLTHRVYARQRKSDSPFLAELRDALKQNPSAARALPLLRIFQYWDTAPDKPALGNEARLLRQYFKTAAKQPCTRAEARQIVEATGPGQFQDQARGFIRAQLRQDPADPQFRLYALMLNPPWVYNPHENRAKLESILEEARRRNDPELIEKVQRLLRGLDRPPPMPVPPMEPEFEEEEFEDEMDESEGTFPDMSPAEMAEFSELIEMLANASDAEIKRMRKQRPKGMPAFLFDMLVEAAKSTEPPPRPPGPRRREPF